MKRRTFLKAGTAGIAAAFSGTGALIAWTARSEAKTVSATLYITDGYIAQPDGKDVYFRGYSDSPSSLAVPGRHLMAMEGDTLAVSVTNTLSRTHNFRIDGVVDSGPIAPGKTVMVQFPAPAAGSYLYYDGSNAPYHRLLGLHGALAVMPAGATNRLYAGSPTFVQQYAWILNDIDPAWHEAVRTGATPTTAFKPRYFTINGQSSRPPGAPGAGDPAIDAMANHHTALHGRVGDRALIRIFNAGLCAHSIHWHGNHVEWLTQNGQVRSDIWRKDTLRITSNMGRLDVIYPFQAPPDAWPPATTGMYPMHLHDEMTQTAGGGLYQFGAMTDIMFM